MKNKNQQIVLTLFLLTIFVNTGLSIIAPLMGIIRDNLGASLISMALIFGLFPLVEGLLSPICGKLTNKYSMKYLLITGFVIYIILSFMYIIADNVQSLVIVRIIQGASAALILPVILTYASIISTENKNSTPTNLVMTALALGTAFGPLIGGVVFGYSGYNSVFIVMIVIEIIGLILVILFIPAHRQKVSVKKEEVQEKEKLPFKEMLKYHSTVLTLIYMFTSLFLVTIVLTYLSIYISDMKLNISTSQIGIILFLIFFISGILTYPVGKLSDYFFNEDKMSNLYILIIGGLLEVLPLFFFPFADTFTGFLILAIIIGIGSGLIQPTLGTLSVFIGKEGDSGFWWGINTLTMSLAYFMGSIVSCTLAQFLSSNNVFYVSGIIGLILIFFGTYGSIKRLSGTQLRKNKYL